MNFWPLRIALARLRPWNVAAMMKITVVGLIFSAFLAGDYIIFRRLFRAASKIEEMTPFFALGIVQNFLELVFLIALFVLFFSSLTSAIGAFFADLDLDIYHSTPKAKASLLIARWMKTFVQSAYAVVAFLAPLFFALAAQYDTGAAFVVRGLVDLLILLSIPVSVASLLIVLLVRYFPVKRVQQIAATLAILFLTIVIVGIRVARPERLFTEVQTDDVTAVLKQLQLPAADRFPSSWLADVATGAPQQRAVFASELKILATAVGCFALFFFIALPNYFRAFVRSREDTAPSAVGAAAMTSLLDRITARMKPPVRAMLSKEIRVVTRDAAQWSQVMMMIALLFIYLYNIQMMPLKGDARAVLLAYLNVGMAGFVIAAICLRFAFPSVSAEGKAFWLLETSPISYRKLLYVKVFVYSVPLLLLTTLLVCLANYLLEAKAEVWGYTLGGSLLMTLTLVSLGVAMGGFSPDFKRENAMEVALSLSGFAYMGIAMIYIGAIMFLFARPTQRFFFRMAFGAELDERWVTSVTPVLAAVALSIALTVASLELAQLALRRRNV